LKFGAGAGTPPPLGTEPPPPPPPFGVFTDNIFLIFNKPPATAIPA
jgi:hypothetical protein